MNNDDNTIDFEKAKAPYLHKRREEKLKKVQSAFKKALPLKEKKKKSQKRSKKKT